MSSAIRVCSVVIAADSRIRLTTVRRICGKFEGERTIGHFDGVCDAIFDLVGIGAGTLVDYPSCYSLEGQNRPDIKPTHGGKLIRVNRVIHSSQYGCLK